MLIKNFATALLKNLNFALVENTLVISELVLILKTIYAETKLALKLAELD